jgi:hypothetical protein
MFSDKRAELYGAIGAVRPFGHSNRYTSIKIETDSAVGDRLVSDIRMIKVDVYGKVRYPHTHDCLGGRK